VSTSLKLSLFIFLCSGEKRRNKKEERKKERKKEGRTKERGMCFYRRKKRSVFIKI
jgi:hypothetical protein